MTDHDDSDHNEAECEGLHEEMSFTIRAYTISKGSLAFRDWFEGVFTATNPSSADDFSFSDAVSDGKALIEVMAHHHFFSIDALEVLYWNYKRDQEKTPEEKQAKAISKLRVVKPDMN